MTPYTPSDAEIEAALDAFVGSEGVWVHASVFVTENRREAMRRALIAAASARNEAKGT